MESCIASQEVRSGDFCSPQSSQMPNVPNAVNYSELPLFSHQQATVDKLRAVGSLFDMSCPGTGKTRAHLAEFWERRQTGAGPALVIAPKSILKAAWGADIDKFFPGMTYAVAYATNREKAFKENVDVYITNHDAAVWLDKHREVFTRCKFSTLIIDESTAYKNPQAARSKAMKRVATLFTQRRCLSGTPNPNSVLELWHQMLLLDDGGTLGNSYWKFRATVCSPVQTGPRPEMVQWVDKPGIELAVFDLLAPVTIRHKFEECVDIPENSVQRITFQLSPTAQTAYDDMREHSILILKEEATIRAINAASVITKLLQIAGGAVYTGDDSKYEIIDTERVNLVLDLVEARRHSIVAFLWRHQRDMLVQEAKARGVKYAVIDGETPANDRTRIVEEFQDGKLQVIFAHPQSAGHGLTLTKGTATIWTSPTYNAEHYVQFGKRIYRAGQTQKTETIQICAAGTVDERVYEALDKKLTGMELLLSLMQET